MDGRHCGMERVVGDACVVQCLCCTYPSLPFSVFQLQTVRNVYAYHNEKGCLVWVRAHACVCLLDCARTRMCVTCVVMNKDVLCVELVVNHWQRWQLTDKQIDPRPPRERRLALAHSSHVRAHTHTCIYCTHTYAKTVRRLAKVFELRIISDHSC